MSVKVFHAELGTAVVTGLLGVAGVVGAAELGYGWSDHGPEAGYFPFYVGLILIAASLWNLIGAVVKQRRAAATPQTEHVEEQFIDRESLGRIGGFVGALLAFVVGTLLLGVYVVGSAYIAYSAWRHGKYALWKAVAIGLTFSVVQYVIFESIFKIPLLKGPLEAMLGIY